MRIDYKKNMKHSYMVVIENGMPEPADARLAESVFSNFSVEDLLPVRQLPYDGDMTFWYNITGKVSLKEYINSRKADGVFFDRLLNAFRLLHENLLKYYLCEDHIILDDETVFFDDDGNMISFCYDHMYTEPFAVQLARLMEKLLAFIDHQDEAAVGIGYGLYEQCIRENANVFRVIDGLKKSVPICEHEALEEADKEQKEEIRELEELTSKTVTLAELDEKLSVAAKNNTPVRRKMRDLAVSLAAVINTVSDKLEYHKWDS